MAKSCSRLRKKIDNYPEDTEIDVGLLGGSTYDCRRRISSISSFFLSHGVVSIICSPCRNDHILLIRDSIIEAIKGRCLLVEDLVESPSLKREIVSILKR